MNDPETCLHNLVDVWISDILELVVNCRGCQTDMSSPEKRIDKNYRYNKEVDGWIHIPPENTTCLREKVIKDRSTTIQCNMKNCVYTLFREDVCLDLEVSWKPPAIDV